jgi:hypothetical protein
VTAVTATTLTPSTSSSSTDTDTGTTDPYHETLKPACQAGFSAPSISTNSKRYDRHSRLPAGNVIFSRIRVTPVEIGRNWPKTKSRLQHAVGSHSCCPFCTGKARQQDNTAKACPTCPLPTLAASSPTARLATTCRRCRLASSSITVDPKRVALRRVCSLPLA